MVARCRRRILKPSTKAKFEMENPAMSPHPETKRVGYTIGEVAKMTGRNRTTIHRWLERGVLRAIQVPGGKRLVQAASLERLVSGTVK
jgi:excisionase family DNA binding protein